MITLSEMFQIVKKYIINPSQADETTLNDLLSPFVNEGMARSKNGEPLHVDKGRTSRIVNQKDDVPTALREALELLGIEDKLNSGYRIYVDSFVCKDYLNDFKEELIITAAKEQFCIQKEELSSILTAMMMEAMRNDNRKNEPLALIYKQGLNTVDVISADLFALGIENRKTKQNIVVIPVNSSFETHISRASENEPTPLISENTIHGQWLKRWIQAYNNIEDLNYRIKQSLEIRQIKPLNASYDHNEKRPCYPIGSVAVIADKKAIYYLTAISEFDGRNKAHSSRTYVETAIDNILETYDNEGQGNDLYIPLIGTGRSRAGLTSQECFDCMVGKMLGKKYLQGKIHIVIHPEQTGEVDLGVFCNGIL